MQRKPNLEENNTLNTGEQQHNIWWPVTENKEQHEALDHDHYKLKQSKQWDIIHLKVTKSKKLSLTKWFYEDIKLSLTTQWHGKSGHSIEKNG